MFSSFYNRSLDPILFVVQFFDLLTEVSPFLRDSTVRSKRTALAIFLTKLRLEVSYNVLSSLFHLPDKQTVSRAIHSVRSALLQRFVPQNTGFNHRTRQEIINNYTTDLGKKLLTTSSTQGCLVADGEFRIIVNNEVIHIFPTFLHARIYLAIEKSQNNEFQNVF